MLATVVSAVYILMDERRRALDDPVLLAEWQQATGKLVALGS